MSLFGGVLTWLTAYRVTLFFTVAAAALMASRWRRLLWILAVIEAAAILFIGLTPVADWLLSRVSWSDSLRPAPAVVVLSSDVHRNGSLPSEAHDRLLQALELLRHGYARTLVVTRIPPPSPSSLPAIQEEMRGLGLSYPVIELGRVGDTHDEAIEVARLERARGWKEVILVTNRWHMLRARAVFLKAGASVICSPCEESRFDYQAPLALPDRLWAFRTWLHEWLGYYVYRLKGWV